MSYGAVVGAKSRAVSLAATVAAVALAPAAARADEPGFAAAATYRIPLDDAPGRGPRDALVTIVEFSDFNCQYCRLASGTVAELLRLYPDDVRLVYRHSLLDPEDGTLSAEAALAAADQGRFWPFHDRMFAHTGRHDRAAVERAARDVGLDMARFRRDLDEARFRSAARDQDRRAAELGVSATPAFFVNGRPLLGAQPLGTFVLVVEEELAEARALVERGVARRDVYHRVTARGLPRAEPIPDGADEPPMPRIDPARTYAIGLGQASHRRGRDDALVTIVEVGDFLCGFCGRVQPVLAELAQHYGDDVRFVFRHMPLGNNPASRLCAEAAIAAGEQGRFWDMHDRIFAAAREGAIDRPSLDAIARDLGLDVRRFAAALDRGTYEPVVSRDAADAARLGARGTPTFFINGAPIVGAKSAEEFRVVIDAELAEARQLVKRGVPRERVYEVATGASPAR